MFTKLSLKYRIALIIFLLEAVMMFVVLQQTLGQSFEASTKQIAINENAILELVAGISKSALITEEFAELQPYIEHLKSKNEVNRLILTNATNTIVVSSSLSNIGKQLPVLKKRENYSWQLVNIKNSSGLMGVLAIEFSNKALANAYKGARDFGIGIALIGMFIIAAVGVLIGFMLTRRLEMITETAQQLAEGDFAARTNIQGRDEIGKLATTFNIMAQRLLENKNELNNTLVSLKDSEQNLSMTLHSIGDAVITTDASGYVSRMNPVAENLTGWSFQDANGLALKTVFPIVDASTGETIENPVDKVLSTGETVYLSNHTTLISKDGKEYQIADSAAPIRDNGQILGMVLVFNDVTEQYKMRQSLQESEKKLQLIHSQIPGIVYQFKVDVKGNRSLPYVSYTVKNYIGLSAKSLMADADKWFSLVHPDDFASLESTILESLNNLSIWVWEGRFIHPDGRVVWLRGTSTPERTEDGSTVWNGVFLDVTERRTQEEQIHRSQKMDALGKLTGGIAHDYNNMLSVILGYSDLLELTLKDQPKIAAFAKEIRQAGERGANLTKKLLTYTRKKSSEDKVVDLNQILENSRLMLEKTLTVRIGLTFDLATGLWPIKLDESDLDNAILNISINAMHAIEENGKLTFETRNETLDETDARQLQVKSGDYVLLSFIDTGCGMDQETKDKIFDPFFTTKKDGGTGLGLSQVYGFVQRSEGAIKIYSEREHGTRFTLYFPRYEGELSHDADLVEEIMLDVRGSETILIVDDESALIKLTSQILNAQGYSILTAANGKDALKVLENEEVDLLLSDIIMPEMDGYQLASVVQEKYPDIKIQLASGFSDDRHIGLVDKSLHQDILHKPYHSKKLLRKIRELLD